MIYPTKYNSHSNTLFMRSFFLSLITNYLREILEVKGLQTSFYTHLGEVQSVRNVDFDLYDDWKWGW